MDACNLQAEAWRCQVPRIEIYTGFPGASHAAYSGAGVNDSRGGYATGDVGQNARELGASSPARPTGDAREEPPARDGGGGVSAQTRSRRSLR